MRNRSNTFSQKAFACCQQRARIFHSAYCGVEKLRMASIPRIAATSHCKTKRRLNACGPGVGAGAKAAQATSGAIIPAMVINPTIFVIAGSGSLPHIEMKFANRKAWPWPVAT